ncbi:hypothetical protein TOPH_05599 [Tolypocladium ophioglossoides CBS 100239]|uniref:Uncharacterized protein n=1 Tax=Tolypocladium ophioglossoides (strain CBS 100239) TaxID=1163406 RepID=A0A0L0N6E4_TOLOC|nr:hypothetical protein TOPH_05599 [Tolypocladium ophioglossoides CBS 100239]
MPSTSTSPLLKSELETSSALGLPSKLQGLVPPADFGHMAPDHPAIISYADPKCQCVCGCSKNVKRRDCTLCDFCIEYHAEPLCSDNRTIARFYEPLVLLRILSKEKIPHLASHHDPRSLVAVRSRFLKNLAFLSDHKKGGATTTAIAVENRAECNKFWLAMNEAPSVDIPKFLVDVLGKLKEISILPENQRPDQEQQLAKKHARFATQRLAKECKLLSKFAKKCGDILEAQSADTDAELADWMRRLDFKSKKDMLSLCQVAYQSRHDPHARQVESLGADPEDWSSPGLDTLAFRSLGHFVAAHIRVVKELITDGMRLQPLLDVFCVEMLEPPECAPLPPADSHTSLEGILTRMVGASYHRKQELKECLSSLGHHLEAAILEKYDDENFAPRIHAEVQLLDHFHEKKAENDRFVACSKPACFCCRLYFRHHPARCVGPDSHGNLHLNWGVALLPGGARDCRWIEQRDVLNKMNNDIRDATKERIFALGRPRSAQPDSLSGITRSSGIVSEYPTSDGEILSDVFGSEEFDSPDDESCLDSE